MKSPFYSNIFFCLSSQLKHVLLARLRYILIYLPYFFSNTSLFLLPHSSMASIMGIRLMPSDVMEYTERGGCSAKAVFSTNPSSTISLNCMSRTLGVASGNALCSSLGRMDLWRSSSSMHDFHLESIRLIVSLKGQSISIGIFLSYIKYRFRQSYKYRDKNAYSE